MGFLDRSKKKLHDGYAVANGHVAFYKDSYLYKTQFPKHPKVDQDKVMEYEAMCQGFRDHFMTMGFLRLHTPVGIHQEEAGTDILMVPPKHRKRIAGMLKGGMLVRVETPPMQDEGGRLVYRVLETAQLDPRKFRILETGEDVTFEQILGDGDLFDIMEEREQNLKAPKGGSITQEEHDRRSQALQQLVETKFTIVCMAIEGMFVGQ